MRILFTVSGIAALLILVLAVHARNGEINQGNTPMENLIKITVGTAEFTATLESNAAATALMQKLPLTVKMTDFNGNEKYFNLTEKLPVKTFRPNQIQSGDLMLYGSSTVVLFYQTFPASYTYTKLGRILDPSGLETALGKGNPTVTFTAIKKKSGKRMASDHATMQTSDPTRPTRIISNGTRISMHFGDTVIPGILNDSETAKALIARLPCTIRLNRYSHDFCGVMNKALPYQEENVHYGWLNGDIDFATDANYFTILFEDEKNSGQYGHQVNLGVIDCELSKISRLRGSYDVRIELVQ